jgi:outer membrane protein assembly factor BamE
MRPAPRLAALAALTALAAALMFSGCVYRMDIQQGNLLDAEQVDQLEVGMTRSQVRFLLGTPMVIDSFDANRWDYVYSLRRGHERKVTKQHLVVWFDGDTVTRIEEPIPLPRPESSVAG